MELKIGRRAELTATIDGLDENVLTGYQGQLVIASAVGASPVLRKNGVISDPLVNQIDFTILPSELKDIRHGHYKAEVNIWKTADPTVVFTPVTMEIDMKRGILSDPIT